MTNVSNTHNTTDSDARQIIDPATRAYIHILRGLGLSQRAIAAEIGDMSQVTVSRTLRRTRTRVQNGEDPIEVWIEVVEPLFENDPDRRDA